MQKGRKTVTVFGLCFADLLAGISFVCLAAFAVVLAASAIAFALAAVCLLFRMSPYALIPAMPYPAALLIGLALLALSVLFAAATLYFAAFLRQAARAFIRFQRNCLAGAQGAAVLPALSAQPQLAPKRKRRLRRVALLAAVVFAVLFVLGMLVSMLSAGAIQFWHTWGWFGYPHA